MAGSVVNADLSSGHKATAERRRRKREWNDWKCHCQPTENSNLNNFCSKIEQTIKTIGINYRRSGNGPTEWNDRGTKWVRWQIRWIVQLVVVAIVIIRVSCFCVICVRLCATNNHNSINNNRNDASIRREPPRRRSVRFCVGRICWAISNVLISDCNK